MNAPLGRKCSPSQGATILGRATLEASASDEGAVARVEFYDGSTLPGTMTAPPYRMTWDTLLVSKGQHTLKAKAVDAAGNERTLSSVAVTVL